MERKVRSPLSIWVLLMMLSTALFIMMAILMYVGGLGHLLFVPDGLLFGFVYFALMFILGIIFIVILWRRKRKLTRLQEEGTAYEAEDIVYTPVRIFSPAGHITIRAHMVYADNKGVTHTTKPRQYAISSFFSNVHLGNLEFSATVYVDPHDPADYAVDFRAEVVRQ